MTRSEAGRLGGHKRAKAIGSEGYSEMGKAGGRTTKTRHGSEFYAEIGRKGGQTALRDRGSEFFSQIGHQGAARVRELMARGRAAEEAEKRGLTAPDNATEGMGTREE